MGRIKKPITHADREWLDGIIYNPEEFILPGDNRILAKGGARALRKKKRQEKQAARELEDRDINRERKRAKVQRKYYLKNRQLLNKQRALRNKDPEYVFYKAKKRAEKTNIEWSFTFEEWLGLWERAPRVINPHNGFLVTAWLMKGQYASRHSQMVRLDTTKGWSLDNCAIAYKGEVICYGSDAAKRTNESADSYNRWDVNPDIDRGSEGDDTSGDGG